MDAGRVQSGRLQKNRVDAGTNNPTNASAHGLGAAEAGGGMNTGGTGGMKTGNALFVKRRATQHARALGSSETPPTQDKVVCVGVLIVHMYMDTHITYTHVHHVIILSLLPLALSLSHPPPLHPPPQHTLQVVHVLDSDDDEPPPVATTTSVPPATVTAPTRRSQRAAAARANTTAGRFEGLRVTYPPEGGRNAVALTAKDLEHLDPEMFLNDTLIDFYMRYVNI